MGWHVAIEPAKEALYLQRAMNRSESNRYPARRHSLGAGKIIFSRRKSSTAQPAKATGRYYKLRKYNLMSNTNQFAFLRSSACLTSSLVPVIACLLALTGCGTTSDLKGDQGGAVASSRRFSKVSVQNFKVSVPEHAEEAASSGTAFADVIAVEIRKTRKFETVIRNGVADPNTLIVDGIVTKYDEGSTSKRMWLGMGFGMSFLEATVTFRDSKGNRVGTIKVDKNSWPLGGGLAAGQNPHSFMDDAGDKIAEEAAKLAR